MLRNTPPRRVCSKKERWMGSKRHLIGKDVETGKRKKGRRRIKTNSNSWGGDGREDVLSA